MASREDLGQIVIRPPEGMREEIRTAAEANGRSMNAEIVARLKEPIRPSRDEIAMRAMAAYISHPSNLGWDAVLVAEWAYYHADVMLVVAKGGQ